MRDLNSLITKSNQTNPFTQYGNPWECIDHAFHSKSSQPIHHIQKGDEGFKHLKNPMSNQPIHIVWKSMRMLSISLRMPNQPSPFAVWKTMTRGFEHLKKAKSTKPIHTVWKSMTRYVNTTIHTQLLGYHKVHNTVNPTRKTQTFSN